MPNASRGKRWFAFSLGYKPLRAPKDSRLSKCGHYPTVVVHVLKLGAEFSVAIRGLVYFQWHVCPSGGNMGNRGGFIYINI